VRICIVHDELYPHRGADCIVVINTAAALGRSGAEVTLATPRLWRGHQSAEAICEHYGVRPSFRLVRLPSWPPPSRRLRWEKLAHGLLGPLYAALQGFDLIHSRELVPLLAAQVAGLPWSFETYRRHAEEKPWLPPLTRRLGLERAVAAVAHTPAAAADLAEVGFDPDAVLVARPGIDPERFVPRLETATARRSCGLPVEGPIVGYAGNLHRQKGVGDVIDLAAQAPATHFLIVGGHPGEVREVQALLDARGLTNVTLIGNRPPADVARYLYATDVLFVTAIFNNTFAGSLPALLPLRILPGTPLKIYDYLAAGRPIIAADQPITRDLLRHEHNALLVPPRDAAAAARALQRLLAEPDLAARLAENARIEAQQYTWEARGRQMLEFFERRLAQRR